jgi:hypothetical protein
VPRTAARCVLICSIVMLSLVVTACSHGGSVKEAASSLASSLGVTTAPRPPSTGPATATRPPTTRAPTRTATVTASPSTASAPAASASGESGSLLVWLWVALAAAAVIGLSAWIASARRRRRAAKADWHTRLIDAYAKGAALHDAMVAAEAPGALGSADAPARWAVIQRRADDFGQTLYMLREATADDEDRVRIEGVLASLQATRSAMEAERSGGSAGVAMPDVVRDRLSSFMASLQDLREPRLRPV